MLIAAAQHQGWVVYSGKETEMTLSRTRLMVCLAEVIPPTALTGFIVWLRGGPVEVAVLLSGGLTFATLAAVQAARKDLIEVAETYQAIQIDTEELHPPVA